MFQIIFYFMKLKAKKKKKMQSRQENKVSIKNTKLMDKPAVATHSSILVPEARGGRFPQSRPAWAIM